MKNIKIHPSIFYLVSILYLEIIIKFVMTNNFFDIGLLYMSIFTIPIIILLTLITKSFSDKSNKIISIATFSVITILFEVQLIFYNLFSVPFSFSTISLANQALDFTSIIKDAILSHIIPFLLLLIPLILLIAFNKIIDYTKHKKETIISIIIMFIIGYLSTFLSLIPNHDEPSSAKKLYFNIDDQLAIIDNFGLLTYTKIDIKRQLFGYETELILENHDIPETITDSEKTEKPEEIIYGDNVLNIDFSNLSTTDKNLKTLNNYMATAEATKKHKYTGMFKDKNLIFILAEGFNGIAVDETRTPTLYKLANNGFVFNKFYSPVFLSTTGGEFQATTGLIPTQEILKLWKKEEPTISYALGNAFSNIGYRAQSYHDWTYTYYKRNITMKTLGFDNYTGCGNGLEQKISCKWLPSDVDMINATTPDYLNKEGNFVTYYVTVSGHSPYNAGHNIGKRYKELVSDLPYSDIVKFYLASQIELDRMLETLINNLEESGELDDTVIALVGDHYPYTLSTEEMNEASTYKKDGVVEVNRSNFILWNSELEKPIIIDKVGSQIDVLPTLLNLFGIEYDSRLIVGKDILSETEGLAIFSNRSWVSDYGTYFANTGKFQLNEGRNLENQKEYVNYINNKVANNYSISKLIIDTNYYNYLLGGDE